MQWSSLIQVESENLQASRYDHPGRSLVHLSSRDTRLVRLGAPPSEGTQGAPTCCLDERENDMESTLKLMTTACTGSLRRGLCRRPTFAADCAWHQR
jgi:hypothetical protein